MVLSPPTYLHSFIHSYIHSYIHFGACAVCFGYQRAILVLNHQTNIQTNKQTQSVENKPNQTKPNQIVIEGGDGTKDPGTRTIHLFVVYQYVFISFCVCVCVCVRACACVCVCVCVSN